MAGMVIYKINENPRIQVDIKEIFANKVLRNHVLSHRQEFRITNIDGSETPFFEDYSNEVIEEILNKADKFIESVPSGLNEDEKALYIYNWMVDKKRYAHEDFEINEYTKKFNVKFRKDQNGFLYPAGSIRATLLSDSSVCQGFADTFILISTHPKINLNCKVVNGVTWCTNPEETDLLKREYVGHRWVVMNSNGKESHIDVRYAIKNKEEGKDIHDFFMIGDEELKNMAPHHDWKDLQGNEVVCDESLPRTEVIEMNKKLEEIKKQESLISGVNVEELFEIDSMGIVLKDEYSQSNKGLIAEMQ